jgi:hypothetical protein
MVGGGTTYRTQSSKRTPFKNGIDSMIFERCLEKDESAPHILWEYEVIAYFRVCHVGHYFTGPDNYNDAPVSKILHFIRNVGLLRD